MKALKLSPAVTYSVFEEIKNLLHDYRLQTVANASGVYIATLYFWLDGTTKAPRIDTLTKVAEALGYEITLTMARRGRHLKIVK